MPAKSVTIPQYPVDKSKAGQKVTDDKGVTLQYDSEGRVICKYDTPEMLEKKIIVLDFGIMMMKI